MSEQNVLRHYLTGRRGLVILSAAIAAAGVAISWNWLAAAGIAPILLALAPCAAMCALGLCMNKKAKSSPSADKAQWQGKIHVAMHQRTAKPHRCPSRVIGVGCLERNGDV